jgi:hypothetical protein
MFMHGGGSPPAATHNGLILPYLSRNGATEMHPLAQSQQDYQTYINNGGNRMSTIDRNSLNSVSISLQQQVLH